MAATPPNKRAEASGFAACTLGADPRSIAVARGTVRSALAGWGMEELSDSVESVVSELVTNALRHGVPGTPTQAPGPEPVTLSLLRRGPEIVCAVFDPGTGVPAVNEPDDFAESGRGLRIVESLSDAWGWSTPGPFGKAVWTRFTALPKEPAGTRRAAERGTGAEWQSFARCLALLEALTAGPGNVRAAAA